MNYIFFGTPEFAAIILEKLIEAGFIPEAVVCNPDRPVGRKKIIMAPATKLLAQKYNIPVLQPEILSNSEFRIQNLEFDFFVVAAYAKIIPKEILGIPWLGTIGVHPSLLPKYRGSSPIQTAILNGDEETGVTLYLVNEGLDSGKIVSSIKYQVSSADNYISLHNKLAELGVELLIEFLRKIELISNQQLVISNLAASQDESQATYTKKFKTEDGYVEPADLEKAQRDGGEIALKTERKILALNPEPGTWTIKENKRMKILEAELINGKPRRPVVVGAPTYTSVLKLKKIQFEGKKPQRA